MRSFRIPLGLHQRLGTDLTILEQRSPHHLLSDPVKFPVENGEIITVSMYLEDGQDENDYITCNVDSKTTSWLTKGDYTAQPTLDKENAEIKTVWYMLDTVEA